MKRIQESGQTATKQPDYQHLSRRLTARSSHIRRLQSQTIRPAGQFISTICCVSFVEKSQSCLGLWRRDTTRYHQFPMNHLITSNLSRRFHNETKIFNFRRDSSFILTLRWREENKRQTDDERQDTELKTPVHAPEFLHPIELYQNFRMQLVEKGKTLTSSVWKTTQHPKESVNPEIRWLRQLGGLSSVWSWSRSRWSWVQHWFHIKLMIKRKRNKLFCSLLHHPCSM